MTGLPISHNLDTLDRAESWKYYFEIPLLGNWVQFAYKKNVFWRFYVGIGQITQHFQSHCLLFSLLLLYFLINILLLFILLKHLQMLNCLEPIGISDYNWTFAGNFHLWQIIKRILQNKRMQDSNVHLWSVVLVTKRVIYFPENLKPFFHFTKHSVFSIHWRKISFGKRDKEFTVIHVGSTIGSGKVTQFSELEFVVDLIVEVLEFGIMRGELPNICWLLGYDAGGVVWVMMGVYFFGQWRRGRCCSVSFCRVW